ncbi:MAG: hypothetical protein ACT4O2_08625 [Beijerinckiaceae bacterium]
MGQTRCPYTAAQRFFGAAGEPSSEAEWHSLRSRWEWSHIYRSVLAAIAFVLTVVRTAL